MRAGSTSVPLEVSTNVRLLVLTLFGGAAVDLNHGRADAVAELTDGNGTASLGRTTVTIEADGRSRGVPLRAFAGTQINVFPLKVYVHANVANNGSIGAHAGVRVVL